MLAGTYSILKCSRAAKDEVIGNFEEGLCGLLRGLELGRSVELLHVVLECLDILR